MQASIADSAAQSAEVPQSPQPQTIRELAIAAIVATLSGDPGTGLALMLQAYRAVVELIQSPWAYIYRDKLKSTPVIASSIDTTISSSHLKALSGPVFEPPSGTLSLAPRLRQNERTFVAPIFAPGFWATLESRAAPNRLQLQFRLDRLLPIASNFKSTDQGPVQVNKPLTAPGGPLTIRQVILPAPKNPSLSLAASMNRSPVTGKTAVDSQGRVVFTPDAPIPMTTGQRLEFLFRP
jgi:hypothetical protein